MVTLEETVKFVQVTIMVILIVLFTYYITFIVPIQIEVYEKCEIRLLCKYDPSISVCEQIGNEFNLTEWVNNNTI